VEGAAVRGRLIWRVAEVVDSIPENRTARSLVLEVPGWPGHLAGQHVDVRLTAEDGYQAQRSYSIASAPQDGRVVLTVERLADGEVSPYLVDELRPGDRLELRGPVGGYFVWRPGDGEPVMLLSGGSGIVPLMAMLRHRSSVGDSTPMRLLASWRSADDELFRSELEALRGDACFETYATFTGQPPTGWEGETGRVDGVMLSRLAWPAAQQPHAFVCGPTGFVEAVAHALVELGYDPAMVRTERFGPTGGPGG
jgi:ferredoxin-NADP reductase